MVDGGHPGLVEDHAGEHALIELAARHREGQSGADLFILRRVGDPGRMIEGSIRQPGHHGGKFSVGAIAEVGPALRRRGDPGRLPTVGIELRQALSRLPARRPNRTARMAGDQEKLSQGDAELRDRNRHVGAVGGDEGVLPVLTAGLTRVEQ